MSTLAMVGAVMVRCLCRQIFKGKTGAQLEALQTQIEQKISGRHDGVDVGYWESLLSQLKGTAYTAAY
ncbi:hypothetical protein HF086_001147 [Spodoptera exigua]|uniref:Splicing factor cactin central domain-containing protein n=1 Tax=Spodoptera exigua TaxID=7107 RepID=A0A922M1T9_SPOEX|nr:hypothetical protein HF086_001147 [Spodoptera exigua]